MLLSSGSLGLAFLLNFLSLDPLLQGELLIWHSNSWTISALLFPVPIPSRCCSSQLVSFSYLFPFCSFLLCGLVLQCPRLSPGAFNYMPMCQWEFRMADAIWLVFKAVTVTKRSFPWGQEVLFQGMCFGEEPKALVCVTVGEFKGKRDGAPAGSPRHRRSMAGLSHLLLLHHATTLVRIWHWNPSGGTKLRGKAGSQHVGLHLFPDSSVPWLLHCPEVTRGRGIPLSSFQLLLPQLTTNFMPYKNRNSLIVLERGQKS